MDFKGPTSIHSIKANYDYYIGFTLPNFTLPFDLETEASSFVVGVVLSQQGHPIAYFSKKLCLK